MFVRHPLVRPFWNVSDTATSSTCWKRTYWRKNTYTKEWLRSSNPAIGMYSWTIPADAAKTSKSWRIIPTVVGAGFSWSKSPCDLRSLEALERWNTKNSCPQVTQYITLPAQGSHFQRPNGEFHDMKKWFEKTWVTACMNNHLVLNRRWDMRNGRRRRDDRLHYWWLLQQSRWPRVDKLDHYLHFNLWNTEGGITVNNNVVARWGA